jgi:thymidylate synthase
MKKNYELYTGDANTLVCQTFSDCYAVLNKYILSDGVKIKSRLGLTYETLNFKIVINEPLKRCTVALDRNSNVFFHLAESIWVLSGSSDLEFIEIFNSRFKEFSDDGKTLHGAYGERMRNWFTSNEGEKIDQLFKNTSLLNKDPELRRLVISLWNPTLDLGNNSKDIPCNTQLVLRVKENNFYLTIFNRSNDLHWGYIANIFQFSFLGEIISLLINKKYVKQTHLSQSLHIYVENSVVKDIIESNIHNRFYSLYEPANFNFNFNNSTENFRDRFTELDIVFKNIKEMIVNFYKSDNQSLTDMLKVIEPLHTKSKSAYEIAYLLTLFVCYKKELKITLNKNKLRMQFANFLLDKNQINKFNHQDYFALALNYFVQRMENESKILFRTTDSLMGQY